MHGQGTVGSRLARLSPEALQRVARRNGIEVQWRTVNLGGGRKRQNHSRAWVVEQLEALARTGRDLGLKE